jgi:DNA-binding transcriptional LysR family regulator
MMPSLKYDPRNPGLSRQLLDLETRLGLPLFHRLGKRMVPTPAGERLLVAARRTLPQLSDVEAELRRLADGRAAILRVSTECYMPLTRRGLERRWRAAMLRQTPVPLHLREFAGLLAAGPTVLSRRAVRA